MDERLSSISQRNELNTKGEKEVKTDSEGSGINRINLLSFSE